LIGHFIERRKKAPLVNANAQSHRFRALSTRRQEETRIGWKSYQREHKRVLVRDMKHRREKIGNHTWVDLPDQAIQIIPSMPKSKPEIFPYSTDAISANFTRACKSLGIYDLRFHDLRHEGISRLFDMGWNIPHVAAVSGHRSWISLKRYTHIRETRDKYAGWHGLQLVIDAK
jgi:integrase